MITSKLISYGAYLPKKVLTNDDLSKIVETSDDWITTRTGIKKRHIAGEEELTSDLATKALEAALNKQSLDTDDLDAIILATTTPDIIFPATAIKVQNNIGMKKGFALDIQAVCSGFIYALSIADSMIKARQVKRVAVIGAEVMSKIIDWKDRSTCVLFGDGAGAVIVEASEDTEIGILGIDLYSDPKLYDILKVDGGVAKGNMNAKISMNGKEVFRYAVTRMLSSTTTLAKKIGIIIDQIDCLIPHQANYRIIKAITERVGIEHEKVISTVASHANTSAASIPLALEYAINEGKAKVGDIIALTSAGAGMTWGSAFIKL